MQIIRVKETARRELKLAENLSKFTRERGLDVEGVRKQTATLFPEAIHTLFTSSPVQGLATSTSDIDIIVVIPGQLRNEGMATQIYIQDAHVEVNALGLTDVEDSINLLSSYSSRDINSVFQLLDQWGSLSKVSRKYLERTINGVSLDGSMPYSAGLPCLSCVWAAQALQRLLENVVALNLSIAAKESRAPVAYAIGVVSDAMDALLCATGFVYSNKKWILSRWRNSGQEALAGTAFETLHNRLWVLHRSLRLSLGKKLEADLYREVNGILSPLAGLLFGLGHEGCLNDVSVSARTKTVNVGKDGPVSHSNNVFAFVSKDFSFPMRWTLEQLTNTKVDEAQSLLALLRAGMISTQLHG